MKTANSLRLSLRYVALTSFICTACCMTSDMACPQGVRFVVSGEGLSSGMENTCALTWRSGDQLGNVDYFWFDSELSRMVGGQDAFPEGAIDESMDELEIEFSCDGDVLFTGTVPIDWQWHDDCNEKNAFCDEYKYLLGTVEIALP